MQHLVPHNLPQEQARQAAHEALHSYQERFSDAQVGVEWVTPDRAEVAFLAAGVTVTGSLEVTADAIALTVEVPLLLRPFRAVALQAIEAEVQRWLAKARAECGDDCEDDCPPDA